MTGDRATQDGLGLDHSWDLSFLTYEMRLLDSWGK